MLNDLKNKIDFYIRNKTKFSRKNFVEKNKKMIEHNKCENLYTIDILEKCITKVPTNFANILDIGCKNWFYAKGEYHFFKSFCNEIELDGIELDAHRLYSNLYSRYEVAKYHIKELKNTNYIIGNLLTLNKKYDFIVWFLPFVTIEPHKNWGLPEKLFTPEALLSHAYYLLKDGGQMLIINQGEKEADIQREMLKELNIKYNSIGIVKSNNLTYNYDRYAFLIRKRIYKPE